MIEYHVGCDDMGNGIYAGILKKDGSEWSRSSDCTDEALCAVAKYLLFDGKEFRFRLRDKWYALTVVDSKDLSNGAYCGIDLTAGVNK